MLSIDCIFKQLGTPYLLNWSYHLKGKFLPFSRPMPPIGLVLAMCCIQRSTIQEPKNINQYFKPVLSLKEIVRGSTLAETAHPGQAP